MKLNLQNFEQNLVQRGKGMSIGFCWADDSGKGPEDCHVETGDTVALRKKPGVEDDYLTDSELHVRVEVVNGNVIEGLLDMNDGACDNVQIVFNEKYVQSCSKV